ncbi:MAG: acyl-CoA dehydrogenase family protein [Dethiobacteria bacterium]|jgi:alkylation response protein AidB-like acyl-CoA dehydrogenase|nr:acyl-CoA dehydrogenase [Bacillota bacterium]HOB28427.1 acyl-CoA dehydrogenase family protein [Bacillota bacterium]HPZ41014.1 acyl-CoA dehydrogenase family protein [Bacillota bacterium]HQD52104.1 acyl-CoA dehydrogenase family protein [Bacillota bacterium]
MTLPVKQNPYSYAEFLEKRDSFDFYRDDPFIQNVVKKYAEAEWESLHGKLLEFSPKVSFRWSKLAEKIAYPEVRPYIQHYDAYNRRIDRIVRPRETHLLEDEIFSEGLFSEKRSPWEYFSKLFLLHQMGEAGVMCPVACTEGLIALINYYPDHGLPELDRIYQHCKEGLDGDFAIGAQYMTEIQGGSDIPSNLMEAEPDGRYYRVYGSKFFCSAVHADYAVVTAKVTGSEKVGTFIIPSWLPGDKEKEKRNGYVINRIKWKLGTVELPTAEIDFNGAVAYPIGPTDRGVANAVGIVLTLSRMAVGVSSAAMMTRAAREASLYSEFRDVFGEKISQHPLAANQLEEIVAAAQRTTAGAFKIYDLFIKLGRKLQPSLFSDESPEMQKARFDLRELILLQKIFTSFEAADTVRKAISIFGGHGVIEDFSSLPRLLRDVLVNELWEGPRNVLLMQIYRDLQRVSKFYSPTEFVLSLLKGGDETEAKEMAAQFTEILASSSLTGIDANELKAAAEWEQLCEKLFRSYQAIALAEIS